MWGISPLLIPRIFAVLEKTKTKGNVIIVDDNSTDGTAEEVCRLADSYDIILISRHSKAGIGSAYIRGFKEALKTSDIIFEMDADLLP